MERHKSWLEISEGRLRHNYRALVEAASAERAGALLMAVVKAGAYGHGAALCARVLASAGAPWLGVADVEEGAVVRRSLDRASISRGLQPPILVMCGALQGDAEAIVANQLTPVVWSPHQLDWLARADRPATPIAIHLEVDTGMSRQGVPPGAALDSFLDRLTASPDLRLNGVLTHFASAEVADSPLTELQRSRFEAALAQVASKGLQPPWIHASNSSTVDEGSSLPWLRKLADRYRARPLVRSGLALYGYCLPLEGAQSRLQPRLQPVLTWKSRILALSDTLPGATIGYNATFVAPRHLRIALLPVGYSDGLRRELSATNTQAGGWVIVHGRKAPILGRISMNLTTVDVTAISEAVPGDEVTLLGEGITADVHAHLAHTIPYEILCGLRAQPQLTA